jgi:hypothetical protein
MSSKYKYILQSHDYYTHPSRSDCESQLTRRKMKFYSTDRPAVVMTALFFTFLTTTFDNAAIPTVAAFSISSPSRITPTQFAVGRLTRTTSLRAWPFSSTETKDDKLAEVEVIEAPVTLEVPFNRANITPEGTGFTSSTARVLQQAGRSPGYYRALNTDRIIDVIEAITTTDRDVALVFDATTDQVVGLFTESDYIKVGSIAQGARPVRLPCLVC